MKRTIASVGLVGVLWGVQASQAGWTIDNLVQITNTFQEQLGGFNQDGTRIAYRQLYSPLDWTNCDIWTTAPDGSDPFRVTTSSSGEFDPAFHPDGRVSYVRENGSNDYNIWIANADSTNQHLLIGGSLRQQGHDWNPGGTKIAYASEYSHDVGNEIWLASADGSGKTRITDHAVDGRSQWQPVYSWSGSKIAYANQATLASVSNVWLMNADGSGNQQVTTGSSWESPQFWWPGDTSIGYIRAGTTGRNELWLRNLSTGSEQCIFARSDVDVNRADLAPDGRTLGLSLSGPQGSHVWTGQLQPTMPRPQPTPRIGVMLGGPVTTKLYEDRSWRDRYAEKVLDPALAKIGHDAPGSYVKFFVPWGDRNTLGAGLDNGWAYNHQVYSAVLSDDKKEIILTNTATGDRLSAAEIEALVQDYCSHADWDNLTWLMDRIKRNGLKPYPILGDGGRTPKIGPNECLTPDTPEEYVAHLYIHARAVSRKMATGSLPGGKNATLIQLENETNYAAFHAAAEWREPSTLWGNPIMQEAIVATLRNAVQDEYRAQYVKGRASFMPLVAIDLHAGYEFGDLPGTIPFPEAAGNLARHADLIALNDYAFLSPSLRDATDAALSRLGELVSRLQTGGVTLPAYIGETTYSSLPSGVYMGNPPFNPISQAGFLTNDVLSFSAAQNAYPNSVPAEPLYFWYQIADVAGLDAIGLPLDATRWDDIIILLTGCNPDLYSGLFAVGANGATPKLAYDAFVDAATTNGFPSYSFNGISTAINAMFDLANLDQTPVGWNIEGSVEVVNRGGNSCVLLSEGSDAAISQVLELDGECREVRFEFCFSGADEDMLQVWFDTELLWEVPAASYCGDEFFLTPSIALPDYELGAHLFEIRFVGLGDGGAQAWIDSVGVVVPDPGSLSVMVIGSLLMLRGSHRSRGTVSL